MLRVQSKSQTNSEFQMRAKPDANRCRLILLGDRALTNERRHCRRFSYRSFRRKTLKKYVEVHLPGSQRGVSLREDTSYPSDKMTEHAKRAHGTRWPAACACRAFFSPLVYADANTVRVRDDRYRYQGQVRFSRG